MNKQIKDVVCLPDSKGICVIFEDRSESTLEARHELPNDIPAQAYIDLTIVNCLLTLNERLTALESKINGLQDT